MEKILTTMSIFFILTISTCEQINDEELVRKAYDNYEACLLNNNGDNAVRYVDSRTIKYYSEILDLVKNADSANVDTLSIFDKLTIFTIRQLISKEDILSFDGKKLLTYSINIGMNEKNSFDKTSIGDVIIVDNFAKGQFIINGQEMPYFLHFYKEEQWKYDMTSTFTILIPAVQKMADASGLSENEYIFTMLTMLTGKKPTREIWQPIKKY